MKRPQSVLSTDIGYTSFVPRPRGSEGVYFSNVYGSAPTDTQTFLEMMPLSVFGNRLMIMLTYNSLECERH